MMEKLRILFMGTPEFAVGILDTILKNDYEVVGVITAADKPAGRGQKIKYSAVKEYALENNLPLMQPTNLKDENFIAEAKELLASSWLENFDVRSLSIIETDDNGDKLPKKGLTLDGLRLIEMLAAMMKSESSKQVSGQVFGRVILE